VKARTVDAVASHESPGELAKRLRIVGFDAGLVAIECCPLSSWSATRTALERHRAQGLAATMEFTLRNPSRSSDARRALRGAHSIVVGAWSYALDTDGPDTAAPADDADRVWAQIARYAQRDMYAELDTALGAVAGALVEAGHRARVVSDDNALVDREAAWRAGIGFAGKNSNILLRDGGGSFVVLGSVVTSAVLDRTALPAADECGTCRRCLDACPTGAIVEPGVVDARRCLAWVLQAPEPIPIELRAAVGQRIYGCDDCQEVCPPTRRSTRRPIGTPSGAPGARIDAMRWLGLTDTELLSHARRWYVPGRDAAIIRRNLLVVLANAGRVSPAVLSRIRSHLDHPDPMVVEHAIWALQELTRDEVAAGLPDENNVPS